MSEITWQDCKNFLESMSHEEVAKFIDRTRSVYNYVNRSMGLKILAGDLKQWSGTLLLFQAGVLAGYVMAKKESEFDIPDVFKSAFSNDLDL